MAVLLGVGLLTVALGYLVGIVPVVIGLFLLGFANGAWDVAMNVQGASVEQHLGRSIMSRYHAGFSLGTVAGAGIGAVMVLASVSVTVHLLVVAIGTAVVVPLAVRGFLPDLDRDRRPRGREADRGGRQGSVFRRWREPRTLLIGVFVFAFAFAEGTGNDWIAVSLIDGYQASAAAGTVGFAVFLTAMTAGRWFGPNLLDRYGRVTVVRTLAVVATGGLLLFIFSPSTPLAFVGIALWGAGTSLGFPVGMSAAADDPAAAAGRVSVVASIGYCAFLAGPPLIGFLGEQAQRAQGPHRRRRAARGGRAGRRRAASAAHRRSTPTGTVSRRWVQQPTGQLTSACRPGWAQNWATRPTVTRPRPAHVLAWRCRSVAPGLPASQQHSTASRPSRTRCPAGGAGCGCRSRTPPGASAASAASAITPRYRADGRPPSNACSAYSQASTSPSRVCTRSRILV